MKYKHGGERHRNTWIEKAHWPALKPANASFHIFSSCFFWFDRLPLNPHWILESLYTTSNIAAFDKQRREFWPTQKNPSRKQTSCLERFKNIHSNKYPPCTVFFWRILTLTLLSKFVIDYKTNKREGLGIFRGGIGKIIRNFLHNMWYQMNCYLL